MLNNRYYQNTLFLFFVLHCISKNSFSYFMHPSILQHLLANTIYKKMVSARQVIFILCMNFTPMWNCVDRCFGKSSCEFFTHIFFYSHASEYYILSTSHFYFFTPYLCTTTKILLCMSLRFVGIIFTYNFMLLPISEYWLLFP